MIQYVPFCSIYIAKKNIPFAPSIQLSLCCSGIIHKHHNQTSEERITSVSGPTSFGIFLAKSNIGKLVYQKASYVHNLNSNSLSKLATLNMLQVWFINSSYIRELHLVKKYLKVYYSRIPCSQRTSSNSFTVFSIPLSILSHLTFFL